MQAPWPVSARELLNNLTEIPQPPKTGTFKGFTGLPGQDLRRMRFEATPDHVKVSLQGRAGSVLDEEKKDLKLYRFKEDQASLVVRLPDASFVFLKNEEGRILESYPQALRLMTGWRIKANKKVAKIVLIEDVHPSWPRPESLKEALPPDLPY